MLAALSLQETAQAIPQLYFANREYKVQIS